MLKMLDKVKTMSHIALITVVTASFVIMTNKTYNTLNSFNRVASKIESVLDDKNVRKTIANTAQITKNIRNLTGKDFEKVKELVSKFNERDIEALKKVISNFELASTDMKEATEIIKNKAGLKYYGLFDVSEVNHNTNAQEISEENLENGWVAWFKSYFR